MAEVAQVAIERAGVVMFNRVFEGLFIEEIASVCPTVDIVAVFGVLPTLRFEVVKMLSPLVVVGSIRTIV
jgi:hypothetical protein